MKKVLSILLAAAMVMSLAACSSGSDETTAAPTTAAGTESTTAAGGEETEAPATEAASNFDTTMAISVNTREDGSGTRSAFVELMGIEQEDESGETVDMTTLDASVNNSTSVMMTAVQNNPYAIGYISMGSMDDTVVKAVAIDGVEATVENVSNGTYAVSRPFNIATGSEVSEVAQDFINYIMSADGQAVISEEGYISVAEGEAYTASGLSGTVVVAGSSSVTPVMEKLAEAYEAPNADVDIQIQESDSTTGMNLAMEGSCDIGMASRDLKDEELSSLTGTTIAMDGIAVIVNLENPVSDLTSEQVMQIYTGEVTTWSEVQ